MPKRERRNDSFQSVIILYSELKELVWCPMLLGETPNQGGGGWTGTCVPVQNFEPAKIVKKFTKKVLQVS